MAISINNGIANINGTPGAISGVFSDRPAAADVANGTLYFSTDTAEIYQVVSGSWIIYTGGGGGTPGIDTVLSQGQLFTNNRLIDASNFDFTVQNIKILSLKSTNTTELNITDDIIKGNFGGIQFGFLCSTFGTYLFGAIDLGFRTNLFVDDNLQVIKTNFNSQDYGFYVDFQLQSVRIGDTSNVFNTLNLYIDNSNGQIFSEILGNPNGIKLDFTNNNYSFGDFGVSGYGLVVDVVNNSAITFAPFVGILTGNGSGFSATVSNTFIGDVDGNVNNTVFGVEDNTQTLLASANLLTPNTSGQSGQYLKINVGGNDYVIDLRNP
jgi:hypothetical protein